MKSLRRIGGICVAVLASLFLLAATAEAKEIKWVGCGITKRAFMKELATSYQKKTGTRIVLKGGGATKGIRAVAKGLADMGGSCRHTIDVADEKGVKLHQVAWDALVVVVNKDNPVENITVDQLKGVLTGKITDWKDLGGPPGPVNLYVRKGKISGVGLMVRELIFKNPDQEFSPKAKHMRSSGPLERAISRDTQGIGLSGISSARKRKKLKMLKVDGFAPTKENIIAGKYPFYRPLYLVTKERASSDVEDFIQYALSEEGQKVISAQGTITLSEGKNLSK
jgi:phosphate transport system substrate-binding protein